MSIGLTRRSLLRVGALSPLIIPGRALARVGGAPAIITGPPNPCGSPIPITADTDINAPGCYILTQDVTNFSVPSPNVSNYATLNNVTVLGNNHLVTSNLSVGRGYAGAGVGNDTVNIVVQDLQVGTPGTGAGILYVSGNYSQTQTPLAAHVKSITVDGSEAYCIGNIQGCNLLIETCRFNSRGSGGPNSGSGTDDASILADCQNGTVLTGIKYSNFVTYDGCSFFGFWDVGLEGFGTWTNVTIKNCVSNSTNNILGGIGGWYNLANHAYNFTLNNCVFTGNTLRSFIFPYTDGSGSTPHLSTDADCNAEWGTNTGLSKNNRFGTAFPGGAPNIYAG